MTFEELLDQAIALLQRRGRLTYRALKRQFDLEDDYLEDLKAELIQGQRLAVDEDGAVLVWIGGPDVSPTTSPSAPQPTLSRPPLTTPTVHPPPTATLPAIPPPPEAERRQLTILFCDLVGSTALSRQLDPEDYRAAVRAYQAACAPVIERFDGHIAQYLGDGLLVYFGYPLAHEDDAQRAVRAGLAMVEAVGVLTTRLEQQHGVRLAIRVGMHTGPVVVGEMGEGGRREQLALGETPNIAARLESLAAPNTVVISAALHQLVQGYFVCDDLGAPALKGVDTPFQVYRVVGESGAQSRLDVPSPRGLTPLVGREAEVTMLLDRWAQVKDGLGQVVLLSGEGGIGKSRLVQVLKDHLAGEPHTRLECRCSPYHTNSALYPVIDLWQRALRFETAEAPADKLHKLEQMLAQYHLPLAETVPLFAALLSLPNDRYPALALTPQQQKQKTLEALLALLVERATQEPMLLIVEDLHWVDPSTLEFLSLLADQGLTARILTLYTFRPQFTPPWAPRSHIAQLTLTRLPRPQVGQMVTAVAGGKLVPAEVVQQILTRSDGVPLFVEEVTKLVLASGLLREHEEHYVLTAPLPPLAIPATLQDALMARLDQLASAKAVAQLGATIGRQFSYELLRAVSPLDELELWRGLVQLVQAEVLYQRGVLPQATYLFKHTLLQEAAYQSLLRSTRQQYHQRIAEVLATQFPETTAVQPELLAHHYTEAGLGEKAIGCWLQAGQRTLARSAHVEAVTHLTKGLEILKTLADSPERTRQELDLQRTMGPALNALKGSASPEVEQTYTRAWQLCQQVGDMPHLPQILMGLIRFYTVKGALERARELGEQLLQLAQHRQERGLLLVAHRRLGTILFFQGELLLARAHFEQALSLYDPQQHHALTLVENSDLGVSCLNNMSLILWVLGYPSQALRRSQEALTLAQQFSHPFTLAHALIYAAMLHKNRREGQLAQERAEAGTVLAREHGFAQWVPQAGHRAWMGIGRTRTC
jgi:predicted ATPase/class 3 adenylate cyclase